MSWTPENVWWFIFVVGLGTFILRLSFILDSRLIASAVVLQRALRYIPAAVLSAIIWPALAIPTGPESVTGGHDRLVAGLLAAVVAWKTKNILLTIGAGLSALWIIQWAAGSF